MKWMAREELGPKEWAGASPARRADALEDLLGLADVVPAGLRAEGAPSLAEKVSAVHGALTEAELPHAIGGALAFAYYGEPRTTIDIDVNVFAAVSRWTEVQEALRPLGVAVDVGAGSLDQDHEIRLAWDRNTVHLFFSFDPLHAAMPEKVRWVPFAGASIPIVSPEHLIVRKATLDHPKDWVDIEAMLVATARLDLAEIGRWTRELAGPDDSRVGKVEAAIRRLLT